MDPMWGRPIDRPIPHLLLFPLAGLIPSHVEPSPVQSQTDLNFPKRLCTGTLFPPCLVWPTAAGLHEVPGGSGLGGDQGGQLGPGHLPGVRIQSRGTDWMGAEAFVCGGGKATEGRLVCGSGTAGKFVGLLVAVGVVWEGDKLSNVRVLEDFGLLAVVGTVGLS